ncbi:MAG: hypothetical protein ACT4QA_07610 [Panacagrimonas sp.]
MSVIRVCRRIDPDIRHQAEFWRDALGISDDELPLLLASISDRPLTGPEAESRAADFSKDHRNRIQRSR